MSEQAAAAEFDEQYRAHRRRLKKPTILVAGYTGSGKSSLIRAICGPDVVPGSRIGDGLPVTQDFDFYENELIRFWDSKGLEAGESETAFVKRAHEFVRKLQSHANVDNHLHLAWYCIQGPGARVTPCDLRLIGEIFPNVIVTITKNDITKEKQRAAMLTALHGAGVAEDRILFVSEEEPATLQALVELSNRLLPEAYRDAFVSAQIVDLGKKKLLAQAAIQSASAASAAAAGLNPFPVSDALLIMPFQIGMIAALATTYNEPEAGLKTAMLPVFARTLGILAASSLTKLVPGLGSAVQATVAFALTQAVGHVVHAILIRRFDARLAGLPEPQFDFSLDEFERHFRRAK